MPKKFNILTGRFAREDLETEYQRAGFARDLKNNVIGLIVGALVFTLYTVLDMISLEYLGFALFVRLSSVAIIVSSILLIKFTNYDRFQEQLTLISIISVGMALNLMIWKEPNLTNAYFVGLIQTAVLSCFLFRIHFRNTVFLLATMLGGFILAVADKPEANEPIVQTIILTTMFASCAFGVYLLDRYQRNDFLNTRVIEKQNAKLNTMLEEMSVNYDRKIATLNLLVHFVKTPLHQIRGFSEVLLQGLDAAEPNEKTVGSLDSAQFIKTASDELTQNVNQLLVYHRLDDIENWRNGNHADVQAVLKDSFECLELDVEFSFCDPEHTTTASFELLNVMFKAFIQFYEDDLPDLSKLKITVDAQHDQFLIYFDDDARTLSAEQFSELSMPLTKITNYLNSDGSSLHMNLRTACRAAITLAGGVTHTPTQEGNRFTVSLPAMMVAQDLELSESA